MDDTKEGLLLIGTSMIVLIVFLLAVLAVMIIYRKRKLEHQEEIEDMNERFSHELLQTQVEVQQQTMQYIGREIHDNVGQKLTLAVLYAQQLTDDNPESQKRINTIAGIINESLSDLRSLSRNLTDSNYMHVDLYQLISAEFLKVQAAGFCQTEIHTTHTKIQASSAVKSFVLRILQEFLQNSVKHSGCSKLYLDFQQEAKGLAIQASDNGKGFEMGDGSIYTRGIGLGNMKRRADIIGAEFTLESAPGDGTKMKLYIPASKLNA
ncbi:MAG TPA: histidine kinase [Ohtaekwangia sp.]|uniref:sensor histidine kinase n=1 Tax=Ohtaekwangia sp. TaxID=2066019 RepID=UPI002F91FA97